MTRYVPSAAVATAAIHCPEGSDTITETWNSALPAASLTRPEIDPTERQHGVDTGHVPAGP